jgi:hypothetical protein
MPQKRPFWQTYTPLGAVIFFALMWMIPAVWNRYPLVTGDAGSYIRHAFDFQIPADRSPFYGVFIGFSSLWSSLWLTVLVQNLLLAFTFYRYVILLAGKRSLWFYMTLAVLTALGTCVGWLSCYVMPDVFTPMLLLLSILYLLDRKRDKWLRNIYLLLIFCCIIVHNSHYLIFLAFIGTVICISLWSKGIKIYRRYAIHLFAVGAASLIFICSLNYVKGFGMTISSGSHVFFMGRMVETGILKKYLDVNCGKGSLKFCGFRDKLPPDFNSFLWHPASPLYNTGGWDSSKTEYTAIIKDILSTPELRNQYIRMSFVSAAHQFIEVELDHFIWSLGEGSSPWIYIKKHFPNEFENYAESRQTKTGIVTTGWRKVYWLAFGLSFITAFFALFRSKTAENELKMVFLLIFLFFCVNAVVSGALSTVTPRYQNRLFWLLPATNFIISLRLLSSRQLEESRDQ